MSVATVPFYKKLAFNLLSFAIILGILYVGQDILVPLFFAVLLSTLLLPITQFLVRIRFNRVLSIIVSILLAVVVIGGIFYFLTTQVAGFFDDLPTIKERMADMVAQLKEWIHSTFNVAVRKQNEYIKESTKGASTGALVGNAFASLTEMLTYIVLLPIYTFLLLYYRSLIKRFLIDVFKSSSEDKVSEIVQEARTVSQLYITGLMIEVMIVFALNSTGFLILGIKYAIFLGLVAALLNLVPYIGMLVANIFCMLITLISSDGGTSDVVWVCAILAAVQFIDNNFLMPMIVGGRVKINALVTIVGVLVGGTICGVSGMFLSIPGLAVLKVICDRVDGLKPYGMLLGDDSTNEGKTKKRVSHARDKKSD